MTVIENTSPDQLVVPIAALMASFDLTVGIYPVPTCMSPTPQGLLWCKGGGGGAMVRQEATSKEAGMSKTDISTGDDPATAAVTDVDFKLEVVVIPVSDVDRANEFYRRLGWRVDADITRGSRRLVQLTPPGSPCSVQFGTDLTAAVPGSAQDTYLVVSAVEVARGDLIRRGASVSEVFHEGALGGRFHDGDDRLDGPAPDHGSYGSFATFSDPDGNTWLLQEITTRLAGRVDSDRSSYASVHDLAEAMRRASVAHGEHETRTGQADTNWPEWYATYMAAEQAGTELPS